jgi:hypothetical protein
MLFLANGKPAVFADLPAVLESVRPRCADRIAILGAVGFVFHGFDYSRFLGPSSPSLPNP